MSITTQGTVATGDTIEAAYANTNRDNVSILDVRTGGDPGAADRMLVSSGTLGASWVAKASAIGYTPVNKTGDTMTGDLQISRTATPTQGYLILGNDGGKYFGFDGTQFVIVGDSLQVAGLLTAVSGLLSTGDIQAYRSGAPTTGYLLLGSSGAHYVGFDGTDVVADGSKIWTAANDGPTSGLAAQTAATATTAASASDSAALGGVAASNYARKDAASNFTTPPTISGQTVWHAGNDGAGSGLDADTLDGISSTGFFRVAVNNTSINATTITMNPGQLFLIAGDFTASGTKSRAATGHDGNTGMFHSFETPLPMFMETGRACAVAGRAVVEIPRDFANYVDLADYHVILTAEGPARLHVEDRSSLRFVVQAEGESDAPVPFSWLLMARQGDMTHIERNLPLGN